MSDKPREFWIDADHSCQMQDFFIFENKKEAERYFSNSVYHVIEYTAVEKLRAELMSEWEADRIRFEQELERTRAERDNAISQIDHASCSYLLNDLEARLKLADEALGFYAEESNYYVNGATNLKCHITDRDMETLKLMRGFNEITFECGGKRARTALAKIRNRG